VMGVAGGNVFIERGELSVYTPDSLCTAAVV
jgi:hypothetical protein